MIPLSYYILAIQTPNQMWFVFLAQARAWARLRPGHLRPRPRPSSLLALALAWTHRSMASQAQAKVIDGTAIAKCVMLPVRSHNPIYSLTYLVVSLYLRHLLSHLSSMSFPLSFPSGVPVSERSATVSHRVCRKSGPHTRPFVHISLSSKLEIDLIVRHMSG